MRGPRGLARASLEACSAGPPFPALRTLGPADARKSLLSNVEGRQPKWEESGQ